MNTSWVALITPCNQESFRGHGPLSRRLSGLERGTREGGLLNGGLGGGGGWCGRSFTLVSVVNLGCQHFFHTITMWLSALKKGEDKRCVGLGREQRKSLFHQIDTDGQGVTRRPSHLTGTNGWTRFPVEANTLPSTSPSQNWWCRQCHKKKTNKKKLWSARSLPRIWWPPSSIRNAILPPVGFKLSLGMPNIPVLWYLWAACGWCVTLLII